MPYKNREDFNRMRQKDNQRRRDFLAAYKRNQGCVVCGLRDDVVLDFHHIDPTIKEFNLARYSSIPIDKIFREVLKCVVLCANDHRRVEAGVIVL